MYLEHFKRKETQKPFYFGVKSTSGNGNRNSTKFGSRVYSADDVTEKHDRSGPVGQGAAGITRATDDELCTAQHLAQLCGVCPSENIHTHTRQLRFQVSQPTLQETRTSTARQHSGHQHFRRPPAQGPKQ